MICTKTVIKGFPVPVYNIVMRSGLLKIFFLCFAAVLILCSFGSVCAESWADADFKAFMDAAAGRYFSVNEDGFTVLELIPAFGELFASSACYTKEGTLYSYSAS